MMRKHDGFTLVELMIAMVVFMFAIAAATGIFVPLVNQFKQQSKVTETNIEGVVGLELLRGDLEQAGFGLPWSFQNSISYSEAISGPQNNYNDAPGNVPRAVVAGDDVSFSNIVDKTDYLVIKSIAVARSDTAHKWTSVAALPLPPTARPWGNPYDLKEGVDRVIVINPKAGETALRQLVMDGATFSTTYSSSFPVNFSPQHPTTNPTETYLIYGVDPTYALKMPFNRADYYVAIPNNTLQFPGALPKRCASGTGVLTKAVLRQQAGVDFSAQDVTPLLDCVADMQVVFGLDMGSAGGGTEPNGVIGTYTNPNGSCIAQGAEPEGASQTAVQNVVKSATELRNRLMEIRVYVLAHEGQMDPRYQFTNFTAGACPKCIRVGDNSGCGKDFDLSASGIGNWDHYRWKVYTLVVKPQNVR